MARRYVVTSVLILTVQISLVRCGPISPSISKFSASPSSETHSTGVSSIASLSEAEAIPIEWVTQLSNDTTNTYIINKSENSDLLGILKTKGRVHMPVGQYEIRKIEVCCLQDEKQKPGYVLRLKHNKNSLSESEIELISHEEKILNSKGNGAEIQEIRIFTKDFTD